MLNKTIKYSYDAGGNILKKEEFAYTREVPQTSTKTYEYKYEDTNWKDKLTSFYDGEEIKQITYDAIGNPLNDGIYTYTWEQGRQLKSMTKEGSSISFKYNDSGIRTEKTVNGKTTKYHLVGDKVTFETDGENSIYYTYDSSDNLVSMNLNGIEYYYIRNFQGDITGLFDKTGTQVVSYTYDSWGKLIAIDGSLKDTIGKINPYLYRGYRYDSETGLYYLQSRYYNPNWGRFTNADDADILQLAQGQLLGANLFSYCVNNPVMNSDPSGFWWGSKTWNWVKSNWKGVPNLILARAIDASIIIYSAGATVAGMKAIRKLLRENRKNITRIVERQIMKYVGSSATTIAGAIINTALTVTGQSIGGIIVNVIDNYIDPTYGAKKGNGLCFG